eukprot:Gregarina_sp_Poly_1__1304@NODE_131_length_13241_cov_228_075983_g117_i0_p4_GENE_NODE_131_length_13241_cov_228_075983_g117_i0NODE_131_length_13241_cov_228_075983_g117_i0_p4_ORF_typecomplete_len337_score62_08SNAP/PF14938_6/1_6e07_NODE_131_length_13241_cov_228_075983_g117_i01941204
MEQANAEYAAATRALQVGCCKRAAYSKAADHYHTAAQKYTEAGDELKAAECWKLYGDIMRDHTKDVPAAAKAHETAVTLLLKSNRFTGALLREVEYSCNTGVDLYLQCNQGDKAHLLFRKTVNRLTEINTDDATKSVLNIWKKASALQAHLANNPNAMVEIYRVYIDYLAGRQRWRECSEQIKKAIKLPAYHSAKSHVPFAKMLFDLFVLQMDMKEIEKTGEAEAFIEDHAQDGPPAFRGSEEEEWLLKYVQACVDQNPSEAQRALNNGIAPLCSPAFQEMCKAKAKAKPLLISKEGKIVTTTGGGAVKKPIPKENDYDEEDQNEEADEEADEEEE